MPYQEVCPMLRNKLRAMLMASYRDSDLPKGYRRVSYIESTGKQYINTEVPIKDIKSFEIEFSVVEFIPYNATYRINAVCCTNNVGTDIKLWTYEDGQLKLSWNSTSSIALAEPRSYPTEFIHLKADNEKVIVDDKVFDFVHNYSIKDKPLYLFAANENSVSASYLSCLKVKYMKFNDGELAHLIPCIDDNGKPCMYDITRKITLYNRGTGEFNYAV